MFGGYQTSQQRLNDSWVLETATGEWWRPGEDDNSTSFGATRATAVGEEGDGESPRDRDAAWVSTPIAAPRSPVQRGAPGMPVSPEQREGSRRDSSRGEELG